MKALRVEIAFFDGDTPLARTRLLIRQEEDACDIHCKRGDWFHVISRFEEPASRILIRSYSSSGHYVGRSAMRMGGHNSDDWEAVDLVKPYTMCFKCAIVDPAKPDWETQPPLPESV